MTDVEIKQSKLACGCIIESSHPPVVEKIELCSEHSTHLRNQIIKLSAYKIVAKAKVNKVLFSIQSVGWVTDKPEATAT